MTLEILNQKLNRKVFTEVTHQGNQELFFPLIDFYREPA